MPPTCAMCAQGDWEPPAAAEPWLIPGAETACTQIAASHHNSALVSQENV